MCLVISYIVLCPLLFFAMHFLQYPGNWEGDFHIAGTTQSDFVASSDGKHMRANRVSVPVPPDSKQAPVVFFGGNAQGMSGAAEDAIWLLGNLYHREPSYQYQLFTTAYRGYAPNGGFVSQGALTKDAEDFLDHALNSSHGSLDGRVILGGWSMGCGVALQLAAARPDKIAGLILFSPWSSLRTESLHIWGPITALVYPWIWLSEPWDSLAAVSSLPPDMPVAVMSAGSDFVIANWQHRKVHDASVASRKWWLPTPGAQHPDLNLEVTQHLDELMQWMKAAWDRVQMFVPAKHNATSKPYVMDAGGRAFDLFGDVATRMREVFVV
jgi:pimeloyl-ACP methyl ester carboxylesterase